MSKNESLKNGMVLGGIAGALLLYGDKVKPYLLDFINSLLPETNILGDFTAPLIIIGGFILIGLIIDRY